MNDVRPWVNSPDGTKWCPRCSVYKVIEEFSVSRSTKSGLQSWCKPCMATNETRRKPAVLSELQKKQRREYQRRYYADPKNRDKHSANCRRRRVAIRDGAVEPYMSVEIAERDGWICQICRKRINRKLKWPHRRSLSIDHIIPVDCGGDDTRANVQATHLICNISKGTRGTDQLRLIG